MIKLNFEESLSNLSLLNSTVTETTALINEQFNVVGSNINSALSSNITNAINMLLLLEQSSLNRKKDRGRLSVFLGVVPVRVQRLFYTFI